MWCAFDHLGDGKKAHISCYGMRHDHLPPHPASTVTTPSIISRDAPDSVRTAIDLHPVLILTSIYPLYTHAHIRLLPHLIVDIRLENLCLQRIHVLKVANHRLNNPEL